MTDYSPLVWNNVIRTTFPVVARLARTYKRPVLDVAVRNSFLHAMQEVDEKNGTDLWGMRSEPSPRCCGHAYAHRVCYGQEWRLV